METKFFWHFPMPYQKLLTSSEVELMETFLILFQRHPLFLLLTSSEVELMETKRRGGPSEECHLLTSSEVELMETPGLRGYRIGIVLLTSSEVELMETIRCSR